MFFTRDIQTDSVKVRTSTVPYLHLARNQNENHPLFLLARGVAMFALRLRLLPRQLCAACSFLGVV
jgi:hypothetical protein